MNIVNLLARLGRWRNPRSQQAALGQPEAPCLLTDEQRPGLLRRVKRRLLSERFSGISTVTASMKASFLWQCGNSLTGSAYQQTTNNGGIAASYPFGTAAANSAVAGADEVFTFQQAISGAGSATVDLTAMTNILQQATVNIVRIKGYMIRLLSAANDGTITVPPATAIAVTNIGPATPSPLDFGNGGTGATVTMSVGSTIVTGVAVGVGGTGFPPSAGFLMSPVQTGGSGCVFLATTNSSGVITAVVFIAGSGGTGYSAATVPMIPVGQYAINSGGYHQYCDPLAAGFLAVSATQKMFTIYNLDPTHTATVEIDVIGATT